MMVWVETGTAPGAIPTSTTAEESSFGQPDGAAPKGGRPPALDLGVAPLPQMSRPVFPWPATAAFTGTGAWTDAAGWTQGPDAETVPLRDWAGADLFTPYAPVN
jgi:feruloyl esterase